MVDGERSSTIIPARREVRRGSEAARRLGEPKSATWPTAILRALPPKNARKTVPRVIWHGGGVGGEQVKEEGGRGEGLT